MNKSRRLCDFEIQVQLEMGGAPRESNTAPTDYESVSQIALGQLLLCNQMVNLAISSIG